MYSKSKDYKTFLATHFPILVCNEKPKVNINDDASLRRIIIVPFNNTYTSPEDLNNPFNKNNPNHRKKNPDLKKFLLDNTRMEQFLTWLVKGSVNWYKNGLPTKSKLLIDAFNGYKEENDILAQFIKDKCVTNKDKSVSSSLFRDRLMSEMNIKIFQKDLIPLMDKKGFKYDPHKTRRFIGIDLVINSDYID